MSGFAAIDFGTDHITDPGSNRFLTDITIPWPANESYRSPYCGIATIGNTPILAMGNLWTYDASGVPPLDYNQQAQPVVIDEITYGSYDTLTLPLTFGAASGVNYDATTTFPKPRPTTVIPGNPNTPWNVSTGPTITFLGIPSVPSIQVR